MDKEKVNKLLWKLEDGIDLIYRTSDVVNNLLYDLEEELEQ